MDWKLIFGLSLFGLAMAIATVFVIPSNVEPIFWLAIFLVCAYLIFIGEVGRSRSFPGTAAERLQLIYLSA
jgi:hypothetical protein